MRWSGQRNWQRLLARMHRSAYLSELQNLPNRNYLLAELRREMPRARNHGRTFVLLQISLDGIGQIRTRRGDAFADRAVNALTDLLKRVTRNSDFVAHTAGARFCVMLNECNTEESFSYLQRIPSTIAVSDGRQMYEVTVSVRLLEYDLQALYATDVLHDVEEAPPLRRREAARADTWTEAA
jgi:diguanylate cyclase (GGDEF)-like protein